MLYLAQIEKGLLQPTILKLLARRSATGEWSVVEPQEGFTLQTGYANGTLVLTELNKRREVVEMLPAAIDLPGILCRLSQKITKLSTDQHETKLWRESLEQQSAELAERRCATDIKEEELLQLQSELEVVTQNLERERASYQAAWKHLKLEQQRLQENR